MLAGHLALPFALFSVAAAGGCTGDFLCSWAGQETGNCEYGQTEIDGHCEPACTGARYGQCRCMSEEEARESVSAVFEKIMLYSGIALGIMILGGSCCLLQGGLCERDTPDTADVLCEGLSREERKERRRARHLEKPEQCLEVEQLSSEQPEDATVYGKSDPNAPRHVRFTWPAAEQHSEEPAAEQHNEEPAAEQHNEEPWHNKERDNTPQGPRNWFVIIGLFWVVPLGCLGLGLLWLMSLWSQFVGDEAWTEAVWNFFPVAAAASFVITNVVALARYAPVLVQEGCMRFRALWILLQIPFIVAMVALACFVWAFYLKTNPPGFYFNCES